MSTYVDADVVRREALEGFLAQLRHEAAIGDEQFRQIISDSQRILEMSDQEIADALLVSRPTVNRWKNGKNLPHRGMRGPILRWLDDRVRAQLRHVPSERGEALPKRRARAAGGAMRLRTAHDVAVGKIRRA